jgi:hypothetical protein
MLQKLDTAIAEIYFTEVPNYGQLIKLLNTDDAKSYRTIGKAFNFVVDQYNSLVTRHVLIDMFGNQARGMSYLRLSNLSIQKIDSKVQDKLKQLNSRLTFVISVANSMGIPVEIKPEEPEVPPLKPFPTQTIQRGWKRAVELPERTWSNIQGTAISDDWYFTFGKRDRPLTELKVAVTNRRDASKSFIADGYIGDYDDWKNHALGHTNSATVVQQDGDEYTLLVASMIGGQLATAIVDVVRKTVCIGKVIPLTGTNSGITSVQKVTDGRILLKGGGYYWWSNYDERGMKLEKAFRWDNTASKRVIDNVFHSGFAPSIAGQADWYEDGYLYTIAWSGDWEKCFIIEVIPNGPNDWAIWSNRMWWDEVKGRRFEPESIWFEGSKMMSGISMNNPYEAFIAELNFNK